MALRHSITHCLKLLTILATVLSGCAVGAGVGGSGYLAPIEEVLPEPDGMYTPPHIGRSAGLFRLAVLLPLSSPNEGVRSEAQGLLAAIQLALFTLGAENVVLLPRDTGGTPQTALAAANTALQEGADAILGPLFSANVRAIAGSAQRAGVPVFSFSTDARVAGNGVYLLSLSPEEEVRRIIDWAVQQGINRLLMFGPRTPYGKRIEVILREHAAFHKIPVVEVQFYERSDSSPMEEAEALAAIVNGIVGGAAERNLLESAAPESLDSFSVLRDEGTDKLLEFDTLLQGDDLPDVLDFAESSDLSEPDMSGGKLSSGESAGAMLRDQSAQKIAILIPEGGLRLRTIAPLLPYHDVDLSRIQLLGTGLWNEAETWREPTLIGGVFAAPDPENIVRFHRRYRDAESRIPGRLSSLGYDAALLAIQLGREHRLDRASLENQEGFSGVNGAFRLSASGSARHELAVLRVMRQGQVSVIEKAGPSLGDREDSSHPF